MANVDVTELLDDPDFISSFVVTRYSQTIDDNGRQVSTPTVGPQTVHGSVQPASGRTLTIMPDMARVDGSIEIYTRYRLTTAADGMSADIVTWQGRDYEVVTVVPWAHFGRGFVRAVATMLQYLSPRPTDSVTMTGEDAL